LCINNHVIYWPVVLPSTNSWYLNTVTCNLKSCFIEVTSPCHVTCNNCNIILWRPLLHNICESKCCQCHSHLRSCQHYKGTVILKANFLTDDPLNIPRGAKIWRRAIIICFQPVAHPEFFLCGVGRGGVLTLRLRIICLILKIM
jgi:hypothetical protein